MKASDFGIANCDTEDFEFPNGQTITVRGLTHEEHNKLVISLKSDAAKAAAWAIHVACDFEGDEKESIEAILKWPKKLSQKIDDIITRLSGYDQKKS